MSDILEMIAKLEFDPATETQIVKKDSVFNLRMLSDSLGLKPEEVAGLDDEALALAAEQARIKEQLAADLKAKESQQDFYDESGHEYTREEWETFNPEGIVPFKPRVTPSPHSWSFKETAVGEELAGSATGKTKWWMNPHVSFREWMSDVTRGTGQPAYLFGKPVKGIGTHTPLYTPSGEPGEEIYNEKYVGELIRRMALLEKPQEKIATGPSGFHEGEGRLLTKRVDPAWEERGLFAENPSLRLFKGGGGYKPIFPEEMHWKSNPELRGGATYAGGSGRWAFPHGREAGARYGSTPEVVGPYVESPEYQNILFAEKAKYYHDAINALDRLDKNSPSAKRLASFIGKDEWKVFDPDFESETKDPNNFLPIPEDIAKLEGWGRDPFIDVNEALNAISDFAADNDTDTTVVDTNSIPAAWFDPATDPIDSTALFVEE